MLDHRPVPTAAVEGLRIAYSDSGGGDGLPIVCLTGWCSSRGRYDLLAPIAARTRRVVALDWRGHGDSSIPSGDFGSSEMADDVVAVVEDAGLEELALVSASHAGWVAIDVRRRLGDRVRRVVHFDWLVVEPSEPYLEVIRALQSEATWEEARDTLYRIWRGGRDDEEVERTLAAMDAQGAEMWMRSGREIESAYREHGSPLAAWSALGSRPPILHLYGQPHDDAYLEQQEEFAQAHDWFHVRRLDARSHFTMVESPRAAAAALDAFLA
jgi:pimeloyl-ACP methyl ester carboxylesterase